MINDSLSILNNKKVSIVVPIYGVEKYLDFCLDSIIKQSYKNLEIICVNDCSKDKSQEILNKYAALDNRIRIVTYKKNRGLFHARLAGADVATGDYLCFIDADDAVSLDWIRLLVRNIEDNDSDMAIGSMVQVDKGGMFINNNYMSMNFDREPLVGKEIFDLFMDDAGYNFAWHTVWNKLYKMSLWKKARKSYDKLVGHLIMGEDIAYSLVLYYFCRKFSFSDHECYFYYRHDDASTSATISDERLKKNLSDIIRVFEFFENFLVENKIYTTYEKQFLEYKKRNFHIYANLLYSHNLQTKPEFVEMLCKGFGEKEIEYSTTDDFFFYDIRTPWNPKLVEFKKLIVSDDYDVISFDLFDTLLMRPFSKASDVHKFVELSKKKLLQEFNIFNFCELRLEAENVCRKKLLDSKKQEDCNIEEIYAEFEKLSLMPHEKAMELMNCELETDFNLLKPRKNVIELIDLAMEYRKKVCITTDIFYKRDYIVKLLEKNNIHYHKLLISAEERKLKATGTLFDLLKTTYSKHDPKRILHCGDNWSVDHDKAISCGLSALFIPKTVEMFNNILGDNYTGDINMLNTKNIDSQINLKEAFKQLPISAANAIVANKFFDKPSVSWNRDLRYNANYYFVGYYALGSEMLALCSWLLNLAKANKYEKIVFLSRDGYLPKLCFDKMIRNIGENNIKTDYFYVSRRSLLPLMILEKKNLCFISQFIDYKRHTPLSIIEMYSDYFDKKFKKNYLAMNQAKPFSEFKSSAEFISFLSSLNAAFDFSKLEKNYSEVKKEIGNVFSGNCLAFDLGYSGRIQSMICTVVGKPVDVAFIHSNGLESALNSQEFSFKTYSMLDYTPRISSIVREYFYSELSPSCIGYKISEGKLQPIFDSKDYNYIEQYLTDEIFRGASDFVSDYSETFAGTEFMFYIRPTELSLPCETFFCCIPDIDLFCFRLCTIEDKLYFNYNSNYLVDAWRHNLAQNAPKKGEIVVEQWAKPTDDLIQCNQFLRMSKFKRGLTLFFVDNKSFRKKLKKNLKRNKVENL